MDESDRLDDSKMERMMLLLKTLINRRGKIETKQRGYFLGQAMKDRVFQIIPVCEFDAASRKRYGESISMPGKRIHWTDKPIQTPGSEVNEARHSPQSTGDRHILALECRLHNGVIVSCDNYTILRKYPSGFV